MLKKKRKIILAVVALLVIAILGTTIFVVRNGNKTVVNTYSVSILNNADWYDEDSVLTGTLTSDYIQEVTLESGKTVKKVYVKKGDRVKKGDILLKYNVDEQELDLKLQKLQMQSSKQEISRMEEELKKLKNTKPVSSTDTASNEENAAVLTASADSVAKAAQAGTLVASAGMSDVLLLLADASEADTAQETSTENTGDQSGSGGSTSSGDQSGSGSGSSGDESGSGSGSSGDQSGSGSGSGSSGDESGSGSGSGGDESGSGSGSGSGSSEDEGGSGSETKKELKKEVSSTDDKASGDGEDADSPYVFYLAKNGVVAGKLIKKLQEDKKYAKFLEYDEKGEKKEASYTLSAGTLFWDAIAEGESYTVSALSANTKPSYGDLTRSVDATGDSVRGSGTAEDPYIFYLKGNEKIDGELIKTLIKDKKTATFYKYASESDYASGTASATLKIDGDTKFGVTLENGHGYSISALQGYIKKASEATTTTKKKEDTTTASKEKTIQFKQSRKSVKAGQIYQFSVVKSDGTSVDNGEVTWKLADNISKDTAITRTDTGVELYVDKGEPSASLTLTAQVKNVAGISSKKISRTLKVREADTGSDDDDSDDSDDGSDSGDDGSSDDGDDGTDSDGTDDGSDDSYTADELKDAISEKEEEISQAKEDLHEAKISYNEAKAEVDKATVKATVAGTVTMAYSKGTLPTDGSAAIVVKAADGMYVNTSISELGLDSVKVGGTITCTSSETGDQYEAEIKEISDFPTGTASNSDGMSNPNSSYYPVVAFIKDADGLSTGDTVEISYTSEAMGDTSGDTVVLHKAYVRSEDRKYYIYVRDKKTKRLKKRYVNVTKTLSGGQYMEIDSGISEDDYIAFPYGKTVKEGVKTKALDEDDGNVIY